MATLDGGVGRSAPVPSGRALEHTACTMRRLVRRFVVIGRVARSTPDFLLQDLPSTSGRLDLLLRCARAALMVSHGVRRDTVVYLVLEGGPGGPRTLRIDGATAEYLRPDERSLAVMVQKALAREPDGDGLGFGTAKRGVSVAAAGLDAVLADVGASVPYVLEAGSARDVRDEPLGDDVVFYLGDHLGLEESTRARLGAATALSVGPVVLHADDTIVLVNNALDRRRSP